MGTLVFYVLLLAGVWWWISEDPREGNEGKLAAAGSSSGAAVAAIQPTTEATWATFEGKFKDELRILVRRGIRYSDSYYSIDYPMGDVPQNVGVSTDIVVRALRPMGLDLQERIHEDKLNNPDWYNADQWQNQKPDRNIDHRRVFNQAIFAKRFGTELPLRLWKTYRAGDLIFWRVKNGAHPDHVGIATGQKDGRGIPTAVELNSGSGLISGSTPVDTWPVRGHFRLVHPSPSVLNPGQSSSAE